jgi:hypothetical protein
VPGSVWQWVHLGLGFNSLLINFLRYCLFKADINLYMKTLNYNPSPFETKLAKAITASIPNISASMENIKIVDHTENLKRDNPLIVLHLEDEDGDKHEMVIKIIQRPDAF